LRSFFFETVQENAPRWQHQIDGFSVKDSIHRSRFQATETRVQVANVQECIGLRLALVCGPRSKFEGNEPHLGLGFKVLK